MKRQRRTDSLRHVSEFLPQTLRGMRRPHEVKLDRRGNLTFAKAKGYQQLHVSDLKTRSQLLQWLWHLLMSGKRWVTLPLLIDLIATLIGHDEREAAKQKRGCATAQREQQ